MDTMQSGAGQSSGKSGVPGRGAPRDEQRLRTQNQLTGQKLPAQNKDSINFWTDVLLKSHLCFGPQSKANVL